MKITKQYIKICGIQQKQYWRDVYCNKCLHQKNTKISNKKPKMHLKNLETQEKNKFKVSRRRETIKIRAQINKM
jgi:NDP-sugar pyrophosphorylase family protein